MTKLTDARDQALSAMQDHEVLMLDGHFDYGNGFHGEVYVNPHRLLLHPATIWRFAQDLLDIVPFDLLDSADAVVGPVTGGALLAHTLAGLLESRRKLSHAPYRFAPISIDPNGEPTLRPFYRARLAGTRVLLADDVRNTGETFSRCAMLIEEAGGNVAGTLELLDRLETEVELAVPNFALAEYRAPANYAASDCPLCRAGKPFTRF